VERRQGSTSRVDPFDLLRLARSCCRPAHGTRAAAAAWPSPQPRAPSSAQACLTRQQSARVLLMRVISAI
jgi:hypothetical protein